MSLKPNLFFSFTREHDTIEKR